jgi:hypothetical protein
VRGQIEALPVWEDSNGDERRHLMGGVEA